MLGSLSPELLQVMTLIVTAALALLGYAITYANSLSLKKLDAQYEFAFSSFLSFWLVFKKGQPEENRYGPAPA